MVFIILCYNNTNLKANINDKPTFLSCYLEFNQTKSQTKQNPKVNRKLPCFGTTFLHCRTRRTKI